MDDLNVTQADRDAAAWTSPHNKRWGMLVRAGHLDSDPLVQAFARHRQSERAAIIAWLRSHPGDHAKVFADGIERGEHCDG